MAAFESYTQLRQKEDVQDEIYIISPVDNPVASMSKTIRATGKLHEWTQDVLQSAGANRAVEGAAAPADSSAAVTELNNYCQIMTKAAEITGTLESVDKYGRDSEMAYQLELRYGELANDEELAIVGAPGGTRQSATAGSASVARQMASLHNQLDSSVITYATTNRLTGGTAITTIADLETILLEVHLATYNEGGNPNYLFTSPTSAQYISSFAYATGRQRDIQNQRQLVNVIDLYVSFYGELTVVLDRNMDSTQECYLLLDFNYLATPVLRPTADWPIAKTGDSDVRQILRESTFAVLNTKAHAMLDKIPSGLT